MALNNASLVQFFFIFSIHPNKASWKNQSGKRTKSFEVLKTSKDRTKKSAHLPADTFYY